MPKYDFDNEEVLIYDIETATSDTEKPNAEVDKLRLFGFYSYKTDKYSIIPYTDMAAIQKVIDNHKFMVGFNNIEYDDIILKKAGISLEYKRIIDMQRILKKRASGMITKKGMLGNELMKYSLDYVTRFLDLVDDTTAKDEIDYKIFKKESWTADDVKKMRDYTIRDLQVTKKLYDWLQDYFESFKDFLPKNDVDKKYYLSDTIAKFSYKAICHALGWEPVYDLEAFKESEDDEDAEHIAGGYVAYPAGERFEGNIFCLDYSSLYPHIMVQCNLYGRNKLSNEGWHGNDIWNVEGYYDDKELSGPCQLIKSLYFLRLYYKRYFVLENGRIINMKNASDFLNQTYYKVHRDSEGKIHLEVNVMDEVTAKEYLNLFENGIDVREYTVKIIINTIFGLLNNAYYKLVYDMIAGGDCTRIGRQWTKYARKEFKKYGYKVVYTDTDSVYLIDVFNDKEKLMNCKRMIIEDIKKTLPFPQSTFDMGIDAEIKYLFFFKNIKKEDKETDVEMDEDDIINKPLGLMKKNYIYVTTKNKLVIKNLGIKKKNISALSKEIFFKHMVPVIINEGRVKFSAVEVENLMRKLLTQNIELAYMRKNVGSMTAYKKSTTSIQAQISSRYGAGLHFMIPNRRGIGVGKEIKYCSVEEFKKYNMELIDIDFNMFWKELNYFIKEQKQITLFDMIKRQNAVVE